ncbi:hypothetical protein CLU96_1904 [Chryseobacterium sp. 52]|uniref:hypothetical protein n=1 Tax=Chryseobacterium sp. 52 TaxID=2035213 RepID=UPI000C50A381|nr:hypothetical protein [Chryseobacterium sp. 52]PIF44906.1 hypothetical protein CLU96_1904 [Chryseobacterium sp. 52]
MEKAEYRINSQNDTIEVILKALKEVSVGIGIAAVCDITVKYGNYSSTIVFIPKDKEIKHQDFFWFGYFVGRDYKAGTFEFTIISEEQKRKNKRDLRRDDGF